MTRKAQPHTIETFLDRYNLILDLITQQYKDTPEAETVALLTNNLAIIPASLSLPKEVELLYFQLINCIKYNVNELTNTYRDTTTLPYRLRGHDTDIIDDNITLMHDISGSLQALLKAEYEHSKFAEGIIVIHTFNPNRSLNSQKTRNIVYLLLTEAREQEDPLVSDELNALAQWLAPQATPEKSALSFQVFTLGEKLQKRQDVHAQNEFLDVVASCYEQSFTLEEEQLARNPQLWITPLQQQCGEMRETPIKTNKERLFLLATSLLADENPGNPTILMNETKVGEKTASIAAYIENEATIVRDALIDTFCTRSALMMLNLRPHHFYQDIEKALKAELEKPLEESQKRMQANGIPDYFQNHALSTISQTMLQMFRPAIEHAVKNAAIIEPGVTTQR